MTNKAAIEIEVEGLPINPQAIDKAFILNGNLDPAATMTKAGKADLDAILVDVLKALLAQPNITEGGFSRTFDRAAIQRRIDSLTTDSPVVIGQHGIW